MAGGGYKDFTTGEVLTASGVQDYLMDQSVMVFGGTAARGSAIASPTEGMVTYLSDDDKVQVYDGTSWSDVGGVGAAVVSNTPTGTYTSGGTAYAYFEFTASGTLTVSTEGEIDALVVAGGGGGGNDGGAGGGGVCRETFVLSAGTHTVTVGAGGTGSTGNWTLPGGVSFNQTNSGKPSAIANVATVGGGGGGHTSGTGGAGASSGGPARDSTTAGVLIAADQGNLGEAANSGGGGGAAGAGGSTSAGQGGPGADHSDIKGNAAGTDFYGGGGAGGSYTGSPPDGATAYNTAGAANTGAGGTGNHTNGGSGIVIVRVRV